MGGGGQVFPGWDREVRDFAGWFVSESIPLVGPWCSESVWFIHRPPPQPLTASTCHIWLSDIALTCRSCPSLGPAAAWAFVWQALQGKCWEETDVSLNSSFLIFPSPHYMGYILCFSAEIGEPISLQNNSHVEIYVPLFYQQETGSWSGSVQHSLKLGAF